MHHDVALDGPSFLFRRGPILLQLGTPALAVLGDLAGVVRSGVIADGKVGAGRLPLTALNGIRRRLSSWRAVRWGTEQGKRTSDPKHPSVSHLAISVAGAYVNS